LPIEVLVAKKTVLYLPPAIFYREAD